MKTIGLKVKSNKRRMGHTVYQMGNKKHEHEVENNTVSAKWDITSN